MKLSRRGLLALSAAFFAAPSSPRQSDFARLKADNLPLITDSLAVERGCIVSTKYYALYLSEDVPPVFSGFYTVPNA